MVDESSFKRSFRRVVAGGLVITTAMFGVNFLSSCGGGGSHHSSHSSDTQRPPGGGNDSGADEDGEGDALNEQNIIDRLSEAGFFCEDVLSNVYVLSSGLDLASNISVSPDLVCENENGVFSAIELVGDDVTNLEESDFNVAPIIDFEDGSVPFSSFYRVGLGNVSKFIEQMKEVDSAVVFAKRGENIYVLERDSLDLGSAQVYNKGSSLESIIGNLFNVVDSNSNSLVTFLKDGNKVNTFKYDIGAGLYLPVGVYSLDINVLGRDFFDMKKVEVVALSYKPNVILNLSNGKNSYLCVGECDNWPQIEVVIDSPYPFLWKGDLYMTDVRENSTSVITSGVLPLKSQLNSSSFPRDGDYIFVAKSFLENQSGGKTNESDESEPIIIIVSEEDIY